jgi:hypothetical protein
MKTNANSFDIRRGIANLYRLLSSLEHHIQKHRVSFYYTSDAEHFLDAMVTAISLTKSYLGTRHFRLNAVTSPPSDTVFGDLKTDLRLLSGSWITLHDFLKPATDAHLLCIPNALVQLLVHHFKREHTPVVSAVQSVAHLIKAESKMGARFPAKLGLIVLPFSSGAQLFQNTLLYHELGEYVYGERGIDKELRDEVGNGLSREDKERVVSWCRELFCDLLAVRLIGPVFSFAFADYIELIGDWQLDWRRKHPPDDERLAEQLTLLGDLGWWAHLQTHAPSSCKWLESTCAEKRRTRLATQKVDGLQKRFAKLKTFVRTKAAFCTGNAGRPEKGIEAKWKGVSVCLEHGIVPSAICRQADFADLSPVTVINGAYFFERTEIDGLLAIISKRSSRRAADRAFLQARIEEWAQKAIDDILVWNYGKQRR